MGSGTPPPQTHAKGQRQALDRAWLAYLRDVSPGDGADASADPRLARGLAEYAQDRFYDAHETWEGLWNELLYPSRLAVQALVKLATAAEHARRGNAQAATRMAGEAAVALRPFPPTWARLDIAALSGHIDAWAAAPVLPPPPIRPPA